MKIFLSLHAQSNQKLFIYFQFFSKCASGVIVLPWNEVLWQKQAEFAEVNWNEMLYHKCMALSKLLKTSY
jgi:hypothetical protein